jgi:hypothetical protein
LGGYSSRYARIPPAAGRAAKRRRIVTVKLAPRNISSFRSAEDLGSTESASLKKTIHSLEQQLDSYRNLAEIQADRIRELEAALDCKHGEQVQRPESSTLDLEIRLEQCDDFLSEICRTEEELVSEALGYFERLPATPQTKELAGRLRYHPRQLRNAMIRKQINPFQAYRELRELSAGALRFIGQHPTDARPMKVEVFRATILLESLNNGVKSLDTQDVIKALTMVESRKIDRKQALRAMKRAALLDKQARLELRERRKAILYLIKEAEA